MQPKKLPWSPRFHLKWKCGLNASIVKNVALLCVLFLASCANNRTNKGLDEQLNDGFMPIADWWVSVVFVQISIFGYGIPLVLLLLVSGAVLFTLYFSFINIRGFPLAIRILMGKYDRLKSDSDISLLKAKKSSETHGEVNHFQALATAMSGTVGLGNISMVAVAICMGGPGATFWMIVAGLFSMSTKFVECTLGVKYRDIDQSGQVHGGPMYYLSRGLSEMGHHGLGKILAVVFAVICVGASFGGGNAFQSNQATSQIVRQFGLEGSAVGVLMGLGFAVLVGIVIIGGIKNIARVTEKVVPFMAAIYVGAALFIIIANFSLVDDALRLIFTEAFTPRAGITGGFIGVVIFGIRRAAFSNEAGAGSAAIAHAAVDTQYPASEGVVGLLEPFIDTVVICTITALVIVIFNIEGAFVYGAVTNGNVELIATGEFIGGVNLTSLAFNTLIPGFSYVLVIAVILFAFSTMLSWSYYGLQAWKYLFGRGKLSDLFFKVIFLGFTILGSAVTLDAVIKFSDAMILALVFPNMIGLFFLFPKVTAEMKRYRLAIKRSH